MTKFLSFARIDRLSKSSARISSQCTLRVAHLRQRGIHDWNYFHRSRFRNVSMSKIEIRKLIQFTLIIHTICPFSLFSLIFLLKNYSQQQCKYDYLEIFDGFDAATTSLGRFCSSENHPMNLVSSNNHAFIRMNTDESHANRGFYLKYKTNCNRTITDTSGIIESPNFPESYPGNSDCAWTIVVPKGNQIHMQFSHFEMENEGVSNGTNVSWVWRTAAGLNEKKIESFSFLAETTFKFLLSIFSLSSCCTQGHICKYDYVEIYDLDLAKKSPKGQKLKYCNHAPEVRNSTTDAVVIT